MEYHSCFLYLPKNPKIFWHFCVDETFLEDNGHVTTASLLYKIGCNPMHHIYGAQPVPFVPVRITRGALVAHRYTYEPARSRTSQYHRTFIPFSVPLHACETILLTLYSMVWNWRISRAGPTHFYWTKLLDPLLSPAVFPFLVLLVYWLVLWNWGFELLWPKSLLPALNCRPLLILM